MSGFDFVAGSLMFAGVIFFIGTTVGLLRFPDFYTRMHAAGKGDTLSTLLILLGAVVHVSEGMFIEDAKVLSTLLVMVKILFIAAFIMLTSPTSTHALMRAGYEDTNEPDPYVADKDQDGPSLEEEGEVEISDGRSEPSHSGEPGGAP